MTKETVQLYEHCELNYTCAICILDHLPRTLINNLSNGSQKSQLTNSDKNREFEEERKINTSVYSGKTDSNLTIQKQKTTVETDPKTIIVVDKIQNPKLFHKTKDIRQEIEKFEDLREAQFAYSLPAGGVALQLPSPAAVDKVLENWPVTSFGSNAVPHRPKVTRKGIVGYMKNTDPKLNTENIKNKLEEVCSIETVRRLRNRDSKKAIPVVRIQFTSADDLHKAKKVKLPFTYRKIDAYIEDERKKKVIRCYNCHSYGHIADTCTNCSICENCGSSEHTKPECSSNKPHCANCGGSHQVSSNKCQEYIRVFNSLRSQKL